MFVTIMHAPLLLRRATMIEPTRWFERRWDFSLPIGAFPSVLERLRGTPVRAAALVGGIPDSVLSARNGDTWSAKEHLGHLDDLHELDESRFENFLERAGTLAVADLTNQRTQTANHNATSIVEILERLDDHRQGLVTRMESATAEDIGTICVHPRLKQPMRLIDWAFFVAEHDDHHLVAARLAIRSASATHT
jgi:hypothetical protein